MKLRALFMAAVMAMTAPAFADTKAGVPPKETETRPVPDPSCSKAATPARSAARR